MTLLHIMDKSKSSFSPSGIQASVSIILPNYPFLSPALAPEHIPTITLWILWSRFLLKLFPLCNFAYADLCSDTCSSSSWPSLNLIFLWRFLDHHSSALVLPSHCISLHVQRHTCHGMTLVALLYPLFTGPCSVLCAMGKARNSDKIMYVILLSRVL